MQKTQGSPQRHVLGDWGTTRLRLWLVEDGDIVASGEGPGIGALSAPPAQVLATLVSPWRRAPEPLRVVLSGMAGSRNGLLEAPYAATPSDVAKWSRATLFTELPGLQVALATGLCDESRAAPDVMRGEETQVYGALQLDATLRSGSHLLVLPGTHSKWVDIEDGAIVRFRTVLTGEMFALLRDHSILLKAGARADANPADADAGFAAGVKRSEHAPEGLLGALFEVRTMQLLRQRSRAWAAAFLSGLLIGEEIAGMSARRRDIHVVKIIADAQLGALYRQAFAARGLAAHALDGAACAIAGLRELTAALNPSAPWT